MLGFTGPVKGCTPKAMENCERIPVGIAFASVFFCCLSTLIKNVYIFHDQALIYRTCKVDTFDCPFVGKDNKKVNIGIRKLTKGKAINRRKQQTCNLTKEHRL